MRGFVRFPDRRSPVLKNSSINLLAGFDRPINQHRPHRMNHSIFTTMKLSGLGIFFSSWTAVVSAQTTNYNFTFPANVAVPDGNGNGLALATNLSGLGSLMT